MKLQLAHSARPVPPAPLTRGVDPDLVMKLGRWRSVDVFYKHYVDWNQAGLTDTILAEN